MQLEANPIKADTRRRCARRFEPRRCAAWRAPWRAKSIPERVLSRHRTTFHRTQVQDGRKPGAEGDALGGRLFFSRAMIVERLTPVSRAMARCERRSVRSRSTRAIRAARSSLFKSRVPAKPQSLQTNFCCPLGVCPFFLMFGLAQRVHGRPIISNLQ
jgi:hypothetical protein